MPAIAFPDHPYTPQLGWSSTRSETFRSCRRRYFFQYYARFDSEWPLAQIQRLKGLSSIPMLVGEAVHDIVASLLRRLLRSAAPIDRDRFRRHVRQTLEAALAADLQGLAAEVAAEIQQMQELLRDPERNIPLEKASFPLTENLGYCRHCQFRELCDRAEAAGSAGLSSQPVL